MPPPPPPKATTTRIPRVPVRTPPMAPRWSSRRSPWHGVPWSGRWCPSGSTPTPRSCTSNRWTAPRRTARAPSAPVSCRTCPRRTSWERTWWWSPTSSRGTWPGSNPRGCSSARTTAATVDEGKVELAARAGGAPSRASGWRGVARRTTRAHGANKVAKKKIWEKVQPDLGRTTRARRRSGAGRRSNPVRRRRRVRVAQGWRNLVSDDAKETTARVRSVRIERATRATSLEVAKLARDVNDPETIPSAAASFAPLGRGASLLLSLRRVDGTPAAGDTRAARVSPRPKPRRRTRACRPASSAAGRGGKPKASPGRPRVHPLVRRPSPPAAAPSPPTIASFRVDERLVLLERRRGGPLRVIPLLSAVLFLPFFGCSRLPPPSAAGRRPPRALPRRPPSAAPDRLGSPTAPSRAPPPPPPRVVPSSFLLLPEVFTSSRTRKSAPPILVVVERLATDLAASSLVAYSTRAYEMALATWTRSSPLFAVAPAGDMHARATHANHEHFAGRRRRRYSPRRRPGPSSTRRRQSFPRRRFATGCPRGRSPGGARLASLVLSRASSTIRRVDFSARMSATTVCGVLLQQLFHAVEPADDRERDPPLGIGGRAASGTRPSGGSRR